MGDVVKYILKDDLCPFCKRQRQHCCVICHIAPLLHMQEGVDLKAIS